MVSIINTLIICATVIYCIRIIISSVKTEPIVAPTEETITEEQLDKAYDDLRKSGELPPDITEFMKQMMQDFED